MSVRWPCDEYTLRETVLVTAWLRATQGAIRGLIQKPTAKNLTPRIDWWGDADEALKNRRVIQG